jgi:hypothetical protein
VRSDPITIDTQTVVDDAMEAIALVHSLLADSLAARDLHAAMTLRNMARSRLSTLVADARQEQVSWAEIGRILGTGRLRAALRYGPLVRRRRTPLALD